MVARSALRRPRLSRASILLPVALSGAVALAGCGSSSSGDGDADPASAVPARAPLYFEATLRPDGAQRDDLEAALKKILRTSDPAAQVAKLVDDAGDGKTNYEDDIEPWLGKKAGVFLSTLSDEPEGAIVLATTDTEKAAAALKKDAGSGARERTYRDVELLVEGDTTRGVVGDFAVVGSDRGVRGVVDVVKDDAANLADDANAKKARTAAGTDGLGSFYLTPSGLGDALAGSGQIPPQALTALRQVLTRAGDGIAASISANGDQVGVGVAAVGVPRVARQTGASKLPLSEVPEGSWLAFELRDIGGTLDRAISQLGQLAALAGQGDVDQVLGQIEQQTGIDVREDLLSWMGDGVVFARGTDVASLGGALVVQSKDATKSRRAVSQIGRLLRQTIPAGQATVRKVDGADAAIQIKTPELRGLPITIASEGDRFVVAIGAEALREALDPTAKLGDSALRDADARLGDGFKPSIYFSLPQVLRLAEGLGATATPDYARAKPYLEAFGDLLGGMKADGGTQRSKVIVGLK